MGFFQTLCNLADSMLILADLQKREWTGIYHEFVETTRRIYDE